MIYVIDPAITEYALSIFDNDGNIVFRQTYKHKTTGKNKLSQEQRLWHLCNSIMENSEKFPVDIVVVERQFVDIMSQAVGAIRATAGSYNATSYMYVPSKWRKLLTGKGNAPEKLVKQKVLEQYPELEDASEHEIDTAAMFIAFDKEYGNGKRN